MAELPILPLRTDALLADTTHMSAEEVGAYCRILFVMWRQGCRLKDDDSEMAAIAGVPLTRWRKIKEKVTRPMTLIEGTYSQKRLTDTWMQVQDVRKKRAAAAERRWGSKSNASEMQMHQQMNSRSNANQTKRRINTSLEERDSDDVEMHLHGESSGPGNGEPVAISPQLARILARSK